MRYTNTFRLVFFNVLIMALFIVGYFYGFVGYIFTNDVTHISYVLALLLVTGIFLRIFATFKNDQTYGYGGKKINRYLNYVLGQFLFIGLCGTLIGFVHMIMGLQDLSDPQFVLKNMISGALTLFNTTLIGLVAFLWTRFNSFLVNGE